MHLNVFIYDLGVCNVESTILPFKIERNFSLMHYISLNDFHLFEFI